MATVNLERARRLVRSALDTNGCSPAERRMRLSMAAAIAAKHGITHEFPELAKRSKRKAASAKPKAQPALAAPPVRPGAQLRRKPSFKPPSLGMAAPWRWPPHLQALFAVLLMFPTMYVRLHVIAAPNRYTAVVFGLLFVWMFVALRRDHALKQQEALDAQDD